MSSSSDRPSSEKDQPPSKDGTDRQQTNTSGGQHDNSWVRNATGDPGPQNLPKAMEAARRASQSTLGRENTENRVNEAEIATDAGAQADKRREPHEIASVQQALRESKPRDSLKRTMLQEGVNWLKGRKGDFGGDRPARTQRVTELSINIMDDIKNLVSNKIPSSDSFLKDHRDAINREAVKRVVDLGKQLNVLYEQSTSDWGKDSLLEKALRRMPDGFRTSKGEDAHERQKTRREATSEMRKVARELRDIKRNLESVAYLSTEGISVYDYTPFIDAYYDAHKHCHKLMEAKTPEKRKEYQEQFEQERDKVLDLYAKYGKVRVGEKPDGMELREWNDLRKAVSEDRGREELGSKIAGSIRAIQEEAIFKGYWDEITRKGKKADTEENKGKFRKKLESLALNAAKNFAAYQENDFITRSEQKRAYRSIKEFRKFCDEYGI